MRSPRNSLLLAIAIPISCHSNVHAQTLSPTDPERATSRVVGGSAEDVLENSLGMKFVLIPAGEFTMGTANANNTLPVPEGFVPHRVQITQSYLLGAHEITQAQYEQVMSTNPSWHTAERGELADLSSRDTQHYPVENVTWHEASEFCQKLSLIANEKKAGRRYRLPTEAEWEYACREASSQAYVFRKGKDVEFGHNAGKKDSRDKIEVIPITSVGSFPPNALGLYDMRGNVWEWCADWFSMDYYRHSPVENPQGPESGVLRVVRGSDWVFPGHDCNFPRDPLEPWRRSPFVGFRVVCENSGDVLTMKGSPR